MGDKWSFNSKAKVVNLDAGVESPCMKTPKIDLFLIAKKHSHSYCMDHCKSLAADRLR